MSNRLSLTLTLLTLLAVVLVTPLAFAYGGVRWWAYVPPAAGILVQLVVLGLLFRRTDQPRVVFYPALGVALLSTFLLADVWTRGQ